ncbi:MAG: radical SAM protein [Candidatus Omnitrophota bacterium]
MIQDNLENSKIPLLISWAVTHRCTQRCRYCKIWKLPCSELNTKQAFSIIDQLSELGTILICFSGGEPLVREDIGDILGYTYKKKITFDISSNGFLVKQRIKQIKNARLIVLSLDGPQVIHDKIRGEGSYLEVIEAAALLRKQNIPVYFRTVLSKMNLGSLDDILKLSRRMGIQIMFQPATSTYYGSSRQNQFAPVVQDYRKVIDRLIMKKENGEQCIHNSLKVLKYLRRWPLAASIPCVSGRVFFHIFPDGRISGCIWGKNPKHIKAKSGLVLGIEKAIASIPIDKCAGCWDAAACNFNFTFSQASKDFKSLTKNMPTDI